MQDYLEQEEFNFLIIISAMMLADVIYITIIYWTIISQVSLGFGRHKLILMDNGLKLVQTKSDSGSLLFFKEEMTTGVKEHSMLENTKFPIL
jgi:hypothetical protein